MLCSNEGCVVEMNKRDRTHHETEVCEFRKVKCHDCSEIRKEVDEVKVNLNEVKMNLMEQTQKLDEMKTNMMAMSANLDKMEDIKQKVDQLAAPPANIEKIKEDLMRKVEGIDNDTSQIKPSVVVAGGRGRSGNLRSVELFNWSTKTWSPLQHMKECREGASSFVYEDQLTVAGGWSDTIERININPIVDSTQCTFSPAKLPDKLYGHSSIVYDERLITCLRVL